MANENFHKNEQENLMINRKELEQRKIPTMLDGASFLSARTATVMEGTTQLIYIGSAYPGSTEADAVWMIQRVSIAADESTATLFADGEATFSQIWDNRESLNYS